MKLISAIFKTKTRALFTAIGIFVLLVIFVYATPLFNATFEGKVIDADTKQPIEGAVVVVSWTEEQGSPTGGTRRLVDVKEILTDKDGAWKLRGPRGTRDSFIVSVYSMLTMFTGAYYTTPAQFIIFKPGYCSYPQGFGIAACKERMKPYGIGNGEATELPKLVDSEDKLKNLLDYIYDTGGTMKANEIIRNQKEFIRLLEEERRNLGLSGYKMEYQNEK